jgi:hypothetical protein
LAAECAWVCYVARTYSDYKKGAVVPYVSVHVHACGARCQAIVHQIGDEKIRVHSASVLALREGR